MGYYQLPWGKFRKLSFLWVWGHPQMSIKVLAIHWSILLWNLFLEFGSV